MPFPSVPCSIWLPTGGTEDAYGNVTYEYATKADIETTCCYAPGYARADTSDEFDNDHPHGDMVRVIFFLPKTVTADLRGARIECYPTDDTAMSGKQFCVVGDPKSYMRAATPGDYSWYVEGVAHLG